MRKVLGSTSDENDDCNEDRDPEITLVDVEDFVAAERDDERNDAGDDDADIDADSAITYSGQGLTTYDSGDNREPSHRCSVEEQDDTDAKETTT